MRTRITGGRVILRDGPADNLSLYMEDGRITAVTDRDMPFDQENDAAEAYVSPGFVEIHSHGADFLDGSAEAFLSAAEKHARHGVTTLIPTATSAELSGIVTLDRMLEEANARNNHGADMPGLHLESPYFAYGLRGAQNPRFLRNPRPEEYMTILESCRHILRWSVAPELPGALDPGRELKRRRILAAIGHSDAGYAEVKAAWEAGYTHVTHLYSGMSSLHYRNAYRYVGVVESAYLIDGMTVEIIADGKHLPA